MWLGYDAADPPGPEHLVRDEPIEGHPVTLADGHSWTVPIIRSVMHGSQLPQQLVLDERGQWTATPLEIYARHEADAERIWQHVMAEAEAEADEHGEQLEQPEPIDFDELMRIVIDTLAINYRIDKTIVSALGLLTTDHPWRIARAMIDWPSLLAVAEQGALGDDQKKSDSAPDTSATGDGVTG
jgi:hypothetical protein